MERKNNLLIGLTFNLENSLFLSFLALKLTEFINRFVTIQGYENKFRAMKKNSVHLVTMCQMESKKTKTKLLFFLLPLF